MLKDIVKIYEYREMLKNNVRKELRARYKGSVLGFFWTFLNPFLQLIVYSIVFSTVMKVQVPNYSYTLFLFVGLIPWTFLAASVQQSTTIITANSNLIKKVYFPRIILPLTITMTNLVNMLLTFIIVFSALIFFKSPFSVWYVYLPVIIIIETIFTLGVTLFLSSITVYFRDLEHIVGIVLMAWMYLTPVIYPVDYIPSSVFNLFKVNPMFFIIEAYRDILMFNRQPDTFGLLYVLMLAILLLVAGYYVFDRLQRRFAEEI
jgi:lipopolysaccharide transport system permease protein